MVRFQSRSVSILGWQLLPGPTVLSAEEKHPCMDRCLPHLLLLKTGPSRWITCIAKAGLGSLHSLPQLNLPSLSSQLSRYHPPPALQCAAPSPSTGLSRLMPRPLPLSSNTLLHSSFEDRTQVTGFGSQDSYFEENGCRVIIT